MTGVLITIIVLLLIISVILFCMYFEKSGIIKDLKKEQKSIHEAYQKSLSKEKEKMLAQNDNLKKSNYYLLSEIETLNNQQKLFEIMEDENKKLKSDIDKIFQEKENLIKLHNKELHEMSINKSKEIATINDLIKKQKDENKILNDKIQQYSEYVVELTNDIKEFENAYVAIGGNLRDIYEDYE